MLSYIALSYFIVGVIIAINYYIAEDTKTGMLANSKGFDVEWAPALIFVMLLSPVTLPFGIFVYLIAKISKWVYTRFFKKQ